MLGSVQVVPVCICLALTGAAGGAAGLIAAASPVWASQVAGGWWDGPWSCRIDGRPARMSWRVVDDSQTHCNGDGTCTSTSGVRWAGSFSDNGSAWVPLSRPREGRQGGLFFHHADGNQWYLPRPSGNRTTGWTTWNGQRYELTCWR